jgi:hypothetical protein
MRLTKIGYYSEYIIYPVLAVGLVGTALWRSPERAVTLVATFVAGVALWTLVEYILHRFVLHHVPYVKEMHDAHHHDQAALIGTPVWLSLVIFVVFVFAPLWFLTDPVITAGLSAGMPPASAASPAGAAGPAGAASLCRSASAVSRRAAVA